MALRAIYTNERASDFRRVIRPTAVAARKLGQLDRNMADDAAIALGRWMAGVVAETLQTMKLEDRKGEISRQLYSGIRIFGRSSLASLRGTIVVNPWIRAHEFGATLEPDNEYFTIPIFHALRPDGSPKFKSAVSWRRFGSFIYTKKSTGQKFIAYKSKETGELRILYVLVDKVVMKKRMFLLRTAASRMGALWQAWGSIYIREAMRLDIIQAPWHWRD